MVGVPASGAIDFDDLQNAFGGSNPIQLNEYYRNGSFVPNNDINSSIPTSGEIEIEDFRDTDAVLIGDVSDSDTGESFALAAISINRDGNIIKSGSGTDSTWHENANSTVGDDYEVRLDLTNGNSPGGPTLGNWHALSTNRQWTMSTFSGSVAANINIKIRKIGSGTTSHNLNGSLSATAT